MTTVDDAARGTPQAELLRLLSSDCSPEPWGIPCAAHPGTRLVHLDGPCGCFYGGPRPVYVPVPPMHASHPEPGSTVPGAQSARRVSVGRATMTG